MSRTRTAGGLSVFGRLVLRRLLVAGRDSRTTLETQDVEPEAGLSFTAADRDIEALDAVAGSEYLDDRIRAHE